jgi:hypothetical protein
VIRRSVFSSLDREQTKLARAAGLSPALWPADKTHKVIPSHKPSSLGRPPASDIDFAHRVHL